jgi:hypothetical protein
MNFKDESPLIRQGGKSTTSLPIIKAKGFKLDSIRKKLDSVV